MGNQVELINYKLSDGPEEAHVVGVSIERGKRIPFKKFVSYGPDSPPMFNAIATNISESGLHLETNMLAGNTLESGTTLKMTINIGKRNYKCEGVVTWTDTLTNKKERHKKYCMGIKFTKVTKELSKYCKEIIFSGYDCLETKN